MRYKEFWIALGLGAFAGGIAALLFAPQSGLRTRKQLKRGLADAGVALEEAGDYLKTQAESLAKQAQELIEQTKGQVDAAADAASAYYQTTAKAAQKLI